MPALPADLESIEGRCFASGWSFLTLGHGKLASAHVRSEGRQPEASDAGSAATPEPAGYMLAQQDCSSDTLRKTKLEHYE